MGRDKAVKIFWKHLHWIYKTRSKITIGVAEYMVFMTKRNDAEVVFNSNTRRDIANELKASMASVSRALSDLERLGVIAKKRDANGEVEYNHYILNPLMYWYGDLPRRTNAIKKYFVEFKGYGFVPQE